PSFSSWWSRRLPLCCSFFRARSASGFQFSGGTQNRETDSVAEMNLFPWAWAAFTLTAATSQTLRNAVQHDLVQHIGARNATFVRFLFGFPFSLSFLALACLATGALAPIPGATALFYVVFASAAQVL